MDLLLVNMIKRNSGGTITSEGRDYRDDIIQTQFKYDNKLDITANTSGNYFIDALKTPENIEEMFNVGHSASDGFIKKDAPKTLEEEMTQ